MFRFRLMLFPVKLNRMTCILAALMQLLPWVCLCVLNNRYLLHCIFSIHTFTVYKGPMGGTHYFVLRWRGGDGGRIFVTLPHFTTPMFTLSQPTMGIAQQHTRPVATGLIKFSVCISQACVASHKWTRCSNIPGKGLEVPCDG